MSEVKEFILRVKVISSPIMKLLHVSPLFRLSKDPYNFYYILPVIILSVVKTQDY